MLRSQSASAGEAPAADCFEDGKQTEHNQHQTNPEFKISHDDAGDQQDRSYHTAHHPTVKSNVTSKKSAHASVLAQTKPRIQLFLGVTAKNFGNRGLLE
jgi:hypothetical protein